MNTQRPNKTPIKVLFRENPIMIIGSSEPSIVSNAGKTGRSLIYAVSCVKGNVLKKNDRQKAIFSVYFFLL